MYFFLGGAGTGKSRNDIGNVDIVLRPGSEKAREHEGVLGEPRK